jgi:hypothetical protein
MNKAGDDGSKGLPLWQRELDDEALIACFKEEAAKVRRAVTGDLLKVSNAFNTHLF